jgi:glycosyltransferase involved in cell wall biosynthesis
MQVTIISPVTFEPWNWENPDNPGIGGSETAVVEVCRRLRARGHDVVVYGPIPEGSPSEWLGTRWLPLSEVDYTRQGWWFLSRCPEVLDNFPLDHPGQHTALVSQDVYYEHLTDERWEKLDRFIALCPTHYRFTAEKYPKYARKVCQGFNGIRTDMIREIESTNPPERNPRKIIFASSPDRGLLNLLKIFRRARQWVHDLELVVAYGFDNIDKIIASNPPTSQWRRLHEAILKEMNQPGVKWLGRIGQRQLTRETFSCGMSVHPTLFTETGFISGISEMACGAIPIISPTWAAGDYCKHGSWVFGDPDDSLTQARFVGEIFRLASSVGLQDEIRQDMMAWARFQFSWERYIDTLETWMYGVEGHRNTWCQYIFSLKHIRELERERKVGCDGPLEILNVGCCDDAGELRKLGAINMDIQAVDLALNRKNDVDVVSDARDLPLPFAPHSFDIVNSTEMLEHFETADVPAQLRKFAECLKPGGRIIVTVPDDHRELQGRAENGHTHYAEGISFKHHPVSRETIDWWVKEAGLKLTHYQPIEYTFDGVLGHGFVAEDQDAAR